MGVGTDGRCGTSPDSGVAAGVSWPGCGVGPPVGSGVLVGCPALWSGCVPGLVVGLVVSGFAAPGLVVPGLVVVGLSAVLVGVGLSAGLVVVGPGSSSGLAAETVKVNCCLATLRSWVLPAMTTVYTPWGEPAGIFPVAVLPEITGGGIRTALLFTLASMMATAGLAPNVTTIAGGTELTVDPGAGVIDVTSSLPVAPAIAGPDTIR